MVLPSDFTSNEFENYVGKLFVIFPDHKTINFPLFYGKNWLGSSETNTIVIFSKKVSTIHLMIDISEELVCWLSDCETQNKTKLYSPHQTQLNGFFLQPNCRVNFLIII